MSRRRPRRRRSVRKTSSHAGRARSAPSRELFRPTTESRRAWMSCRRADRRPPLVRPERTVRSSGRSRFAEGVLSSRTSPPGKGGALKRNSAVSRRIAQPRSRLAVESVTPALGAARSGDLRLPRRNGSMHRWIRRPPVPGSGSYTASTLDTFRPDPVSRRRRIGAVAAAVPAERFDTPGRRRVVAPTPERSRVRPRRHWSSSHGGRGGFVPFPDPRGTRPVRRRSRVSDRNQRRVWAATSKLWNHGA